MRRAGLYLRISKDRDGSGSAVERQREDGLRLITARRWELHDEYVDNDISARGRKRRPAFERLLEDLRTGVIDTLVSERWDRLSRNRRDELRLIELCQKRQALVALMKGSDIDMSNAAGRLFADMLGGFARHEIEIKGERQARQARQQAERGQMTSARRAFGYLPGGMELDPLEAPLLVQMYQRWLTGEGMAGIARWLNAQGVKTTQGKVWRYATVREVLANPRNAALRGMRDVVNTDTGTRAQWHRIVGPAVWPPIVSESTWRAAVERIKDPNRPGAHIGRSALTHLLTGIALCGVEVEESDEGARRCGRALISGWRSGYRTLRCPSLRHVNRRGDAIEDYVQQTLLLRLRRKDAPRLGGVTKSDLDVEATRAEAIELRAKLRGLAADYADGVLGRDEVRFVRQRLRSRLDEINALVTEAGQVDVLAPLRAAEDPAVVWAGYSLPERRESIRRAVTVHVLAGYPGQPRGERFWPETVDFTWHEAP